MSLLTVFSAPKPFTNSHIATIQENAIQSWKHLEPDVDVILIGEEDGLADAARRSGARHLPGVKHNQEGTPLVSSIIGLARENSQSPLLAYVNADIILFPDFVKAARETALLVKKFLIVGRRWDLDIKEPINFNDDWVSKLRELNSRAGTLYLPSGSDYFIFPRTVFSDVPDFAIGRAGWDNWMIYKSRRERWATIDATSSILVIHQIHDYSHLPGGQPHYHLPESYENIRLAGGSLRKNFQLIDTNHRLIHNRLRAPVLSVKKILREIEILPLLYWKSEKLALLFFYIFHPGRAYWRIVAEVKRIFGFRQEK